MKKYKRIFKLKTAINITNDKQRISNIVMPYKSTLMSYSSKDIREYIYPWCLETYKSDTWHISILGDGGMGYVAFVNESDLTLFLLKWT